MIPYAALLLIDVQQGLDDPCWGTRNNLSAEDNIAMLLQAWRKLGLPVVHVQHLSSNPASPLSPDKAGCAFKHSTAPLADEAVFRKHVNSAFIGTGLEDYLRSHNLQRLVVVGLTTDHCVSTTVRMAGNLGFEVYLVADATATFARQDPSGNSISAEAMHQAHLASLQGEFCTVLATAEALARFAVAPAPSSPTPQHSDAKGTKQ